MLKTFLKENKKKLIIVTAGVLVLLGIVTAGTTFYYLKNRASVSDGTVATALTSLDVMETLTFTEDKTVFTNPERGFYTPLESEKLTLEDFSILATRKHSIVLIETNLAVAANGNASALASGSTLKNQPLSDAKLAEISNSFTLARKAGAKVLYRGAYGYNDADIAPEPADINVLLNHIEQLKPIFAANEDVLYAVQLGWLGTWGEWHSTIYGKTPLKYNDIPLDVQKRVSSALLAAVPKSRMVQIREPRQIRAITNGVRVNDATAFDGSDVSRIGFYNDGLFNDSDDCGTYLLAEVVSGKVEFDTREKELEWMSPQTKYTPYGGESNGLTSYSDSNNAVKEFKQLHAQYVNLEYFGKVITKWKNSTYNGENTFDYISRHLGYKFLMEDAQISSQVYAGGALHVVLDIKNDGFGGLINERNMEVVLSNGTTTYKAKVDGDMRKWYRENGVMTKDLYFSVPANITLGNWNLYLNFPDKAESLKNNPQYSIRLANNGVWNSATGYNTLKKGIVIGSAGLLSTNNEFKQLNRTQAESVLGVATAKTVTNIGLSPTDPELKPGENINLTATILPIDATIKTLTYSTSNSSVATVDTTGKVTAVSEGVAEITATAVSGGAMSKATITVLKSTTANAIPVVSVSLLPALSTVIKGESLTLTTIISPENSTSKAVSYISSNTSIARVDSVGKVTAVSAGVAVITVTSVGEGKTSTALVTVSQPVESVNMSPTSLNLVKGTTGSVTGSVVPSYASNQTITYSSSNNSIATVDSTGKITAIEVGNVIITAKSVDGNKTANCNVTITTTTPIEVTGWSDINPIASATTGYANSLKVFNNDKTLYLLASGTNLNSKSQFYIDSDNNSSTGFKTKWTASGAEYLIENKYLYKYTGTSNNWSWKQVSSAGISLTKSDSRVGVSISLSAMNLSSGKTIHIGFLSSDSNQKILPLRSQALPSYTLIGGSKILIF